MIVHAKILTQTINKIEGLLPDKKQNNLQLLYIFYYVYNANATINIISKNHNKLAFSQTISYLPRTKVPA